MDSEGSFKWALNIYETVFSIQKNVHTLKELKKQTEAWRHTEHKILLTVWKESYHFVPSDHI